MYVDDLLKAGNERFQRHANGTLKLFEYTERVKDKL